MKQIKHFNDSEKAIKVDNNLEVCLQGVTQRLLDKYKPSKKFTIIDGKSLKPNEPKAA